MSVETDGIRPFLKQITQSGVGGFGIITAVSGKRLVLRSAILVCDTDSPGTFGRLSFTDKPRIAQMVAVKGPSVIYDAASPPLPSSATGAALRLDVEAVESGTNGFADIGAWIYGTYEIEG